MLGSTPLSATPLSARKQSITIVVGGWIKNVVKYFITAYGRSATGNKQGVEVTQVAQNINM